MDRTGMRFGTIFVFVYELFIKGHGKNPKTKSKTKTKMY
jgi:hypothetical protein